MADYVVWGKKGTGKSKFAIHVMRQAAAEGRRIACNFPINLDKLLPGWHRVAYTQLPDRPTGEHLDALGHGNPDSYDEERNGVLVLDETGVWLNSRNFQEAKRDELVNWAVHGRKFGWDIYWLCQGAVQIDRQVRETQLEYSVQMRKLDKVRLPGVGYVAQLLGMRGTFPKGTHSAVIKLGFDRDAPLVDRKIFRANDLHECYDTRHIFRDDPSQVPVTWLGPRYFVPVPPQRRPGIRGVLERTFARPAPKVKPAREWPETVMRLPPDLRWEMARRLTSASPAAHRKLRLVPRPPAEPHDREAATPQEWAAYLRGGLADCA